MIFLACYLTGVFVMAGTLFFVVAGDFGWIESVLGSFLWPLTLALNGVRTTTRHVRRARMLRERQAGTPR